MWGILNIPWTYSSIKTLWKLSELCKRVSEQHVRMGAVEQYTDDCLGGTGIVYNLEWHNIQTTKDKKYYWKHIETNVIYALIYKNIQTAY